jgi:hypothetical protein
MDCRHLLQAKIQGLAFVNKVMDLVSSEGRREYVTPPT